jgi:acylphosphatase
MPTIHLTIKGKVQGVFFRASAKDKADEIGVRGWVKNTDDGNVEAMVNGNKEQLQKFIEWCKTGPPRAVVTDIAITYKEEEIFDGFRVFRK